MNSDTLGAADAENPNVFLQLTAEVVSSHISNNGVSVEDLPTLIREVHSALASVETLANGNTKRKPAVAIKKSVTPDFIICLEDGRKLKMLKRHLKTAYNLTPQDYRNRWKLAADYPMVAPNYAKRRSSIAKKIGLGKKR